MNQRFKYPKIYHLPWSEGITNKDKVLDSVEHFIGKEVIVTLKMDGENTSIYNDYIHARSLDSKYHESRTWVFKLQGEIGYLLKDNERLVGENLAAKHSIYYKELEYFFYVFSYWIGDICQNWVDTVAKAKEFKLPTVPVLYKGIWNEKLIRELYHKEYQGNEMEGYVVRSVDNFNINDFNKSIAKMVRTDHVKTAKNWMREEITLNEWEK